MHNPPSIPQTPYQTLITPCPNFDLIYQIILLENSNEWNLSPAKEGSSERERERRKRKRKKNKKEKEQGLKSKRGKTSFEKIHVSKRGKRKEKEDEAAWRDSIKKQRKEITFFYSAKSDVWPHPYPHIICIYTTFYSLTFPFLTPYTTPFSINHDYLSHKLFRIFFCFYNI
jgi:hypothetical protein